MSSDFGSGDSSGFVRFIAGVFVYIAGAIMIVGIWLLWALLPGFLHPSLFDLPDRTVQVPYEEVLGWPGAIMGANNNVSVKVPNTVVAKDCEAPFLLRPVVGAPKNVTVEITDGAAVLSSQTFACKSFK